MKQIAIILSLMFLNSCIEPMEDQKFKTSEFELRQLVKTTEKSKISEASFFLIYASYSSSDKSETTIKMFANVDGYYRVVDVPIEYIRVKIDNSMFIPTLHIQYEDHIERSNDWLIGNPYRNIYKMAFVITCPEIYLPERLLPIEL